MSTKLQCTDWQIDPDGVVRCLGIASEAASWLPPLTESEVYMLATSAAALFATVFGIRVLMRVIR